MGIMVQRSESEKAAIRKSLGISARESRIHDLEDMLCRALIQMDRPPDAFSTDVHWDVWDGFMAEASRLLSAS